MKYQIDEEKADEALRALNGLTRFLHEESYRRDAAFRMELMYLSGLSFDEHTLRRLWHELQYRFQRDWYEFLNIKMNQHINEYPDTRIRDLANFSTRIGIHMYLEPVDAK